MAQPHSGRFETSARSGRSEGESYTGDTSTFGTDTVSSSDDYARVQDILLLQNLCENAHEDDENSWEAVREWLRSHTAEDAQQGAERRGDCSTTALHLACRNCPPVDIVHVLLSAAPDTVQWADSFGWLPLHYACANGASEEVLRLLAETYPESRTSIDNRGRTPLHFLLGNTERPATPSAVVLLSSTGAALCADENGMLPLHYACAYGASEESLHALTDGNIDSITATDRRGRTPLHFALGNADRPASPAVVKLLLSQNREVVNSTDREGRQLPLHLLAIRATTLTNEQQSERDNAEKCLDLYLKAEPKPTAALLTALQNLPDWLSDRAVVTPIVQSMLNKKISQRFPTLILVLDFYMLCAIIITYSLTVKDSIHRRFDPERDDAIPWSHLVPMLIGGIYYLIREVVQMSALLSLGLFRTWLHDPTNWLDVTFIFLIFFWGIIMGTGGGDKYRFRTGTALSLFFLWANVLSFLKSILVDFAVFIGGVLYVVRRLTAFIIALGVILVMFAQMFVTVFQQTSYCDPLDFEQQVDLVVSGYELGRVNTPFCKFWPAFVKVYTMLLGEVDENDFQGSKIAKVLYGAFMFLCVILLANVLIAIVTDSYGVIRNERAAIVFWSNRLDFVAEMDAISAGPWKKKMRNAFMVCKADDDDERDTSQDVPFGRDLWKKLFELFEDNLEESSVLSVEFWCYNLLRLFTAVFVIPLWLALGVFTFGWLWPPQVREGLFTQRISKHNTGDVKEAEQRSEQVKELRQEVKDLQDEVVTEMAADRKEVVQMKSQIVNMKTEITDEMKHIKQVMNMLFELQSSMDPEG